MLAACIPPAPAQLGPRSLHSAKASSQAAQAAAQTLVADGFEIVTSDATNGIVTARRLRAAKGNDDFVVCRGAKNSIAATNKETTITVSFIAKPAAAGSDITISNNVRVAFPGLTGLLASAPNEEDCASTGVAETHLAAATTP